MKLFFVGEGRIGTGEGLPRMEGVAIGPFERVNELTIVSTDL
jgi:hypothetical protein